MNLFLSKSNYFRRNRLYRIPLFKTVVRFLSGSNLSSFRFSSKSFRENGENGPKKNHCIRHNIIHYSQSKNMNSLSKTFEDITFNSDLQNDVKKWLHEFSIIASETTQIRFSPATRIGIWLDFQNYQIQDFSKERRSYHYNIKRSK